MVPLWTPTTRGKSKGCAFSALSSPLVAARVWPMSARVSPGGENISFSRSDGALRAETASRVDFHVLYSGGLSFSWWAQMMPVLSIPRRIETRSRSLKMARSLSVRNEETTPTIPHMWGSLLLRGDQIICPATLLSMLNLFIQATGTSAKKSFIGTRLC